MEKTIKISPDLFKIKSRQSGAHQKTRSNKNVKRLLSKIKEHAKQYNKQENKQQNKVDILKPQNTNFNQHIEYLESIRQKRKKTRSNRPQEQVNLTVPEGLTQIKIKPAPQYGILKGGSTPTIREWKRLTQKNYITENNPTLEPSKSMLEPSKPTLQESNLHSNSKSLPKMMDVKTYKVENKFKLGPSKDKKTTSIYIKNRKTRKKIQDDIQILNKASLSQVKSYLKKYNLYKSGSNAPPDLLREIYRSAHLAGKPVINNSSENLIHNFYS